MMKANEKPSTRTPVMLGFLAALGASLLTGCHAALPQGPPRSPHLVTPDEDHCALCEVYHRAEAQVVRVMTPKGQGAGIVISAGGLLLTNAHVVGGQAEVVVETHDGRRLPATVTRRNPVLDLALLEIESRGTQWRPIRVDAVGLPPVGSEAFVIGHPLGLGWTVTRGIVSGHRRAGEISPVVMIQTDAAVSPGNSGGPLLDARGRLIGLVTSKLLAPGAENVSFAIPASVLARFVAAGA